MTATTNTKEQALEEKDELLETLIKDFQSKALEIGYVTAMALTSIEKHPLKGYRNVITANISDEHYALGVPTENALIKLMIRLHDDKRQHGGVIAPTNGEE